MKDNLEKQAKPETATELRQSVAAGVSGENTLTPGVSGENTLTPEQIENWRRVLCGMIGPYALIAPDEVIQGLRNRFQEVLDYEESR